MILPGVGTAIGAGVGALGRFTYCCIELWLARNQIIFALLILKTLSKLERKSLKKIKRKKNKKIKKSSNEWKAKVWKNKRLNKVWTNNSRELDVDNNLLVTWGAGDRNKKLKNLSKLSSILVAKIRHRHWSHFKLVLTLDFSAFRFQSWKFHGRK